jgi:hypothetical protein
MKDAVSQDPALLNNDEHFSDKLKGSFPSR